MITCTILVRDRMTNVLFDLSSDYSYVSFKFALVFYMIFDVLDAPIHVFIPFEESLIVTHVYCACRILFTGFQTWDDLFILHMTDFNIILSMIGFSPIMLSLTVTQRLGL